eukprot:1141837-Pelagomonas_calceolata.AAC.4
MQSACMGKFQQQRVKERNARPKVQVEAKLKRQAQNAVWKAKHKEKKVASLATAAAAEQQQEQQQEQQHHGDRQQRAGQHSVVSRQRR